LRNRTSTVFLLICHDWSRALLHCDVRISCTQTKQTKSELMNSKSFAYVSTFKFHELIQTKARRQTNTMKHVIWIFRLRFVVMVSLFQIIAMRSNRVHVVEINICSARLLEIRIFTMLHVETVRFSNCHRLFFKLFPSSHRILFFPTLLGGSNIY